jgi:hypothetical protein
MAICKL